MDLKTIIVLVILIVLSYYALVRRETYDGKIVHIPADLHCFFKKYDLCSSKSDHKIGKAEITDIGNTVAIIIDYDGKKRYLAKSIVEIKPSEEYVFITSCSSGDDKIVIKKTKTDVTIMINRDIYKLREL